MAEIHPVFVFDVAASLDLDAAEKAIGALGAHGARQTFRHRGRSTSFFTYRPAPLRVERDGEPVAVGAFTTQRIVDLVLYDFGAASVAYEIDVADDLDELEVAHEAVLRSDALRRDARSKVEELLRSLGPVANRPGIADFTEDYVIIGLSDVPGGLTSEAFADAHAERIAALLRPGSDPPSAEEVRDATACRISFGPSDLSIVDWDAAFVLDPEPEDVRAVLEFANVQMLEMRWLDLQLDRAIERSYGLLARHGRWTDLLPRLRTNELREVAELQLESAVMLERVSNALKVFGEEYLARIYRLASRRFQLDELDATLTRKLDVIDGIYEKLNDRANTRRLEILEWIVIILIAVEIALTLGGH
jgi:hypothetical protein